MSTIYEVKNNIRHNTDIFEAGNIVAEEAFGENAEESIADLIRSGAIEVVEGASTPEEAAEIIAKKVAQAEEEAKVLAETAPKDTWGPQPDAAPEEEVQKDPTEVIPQTDGTDATNENAPANAGEIIDNPADRGAVNEGQTPATNEDAGDNL